MIVYIPFWQASDPQLCSFDRFLFGASDSDSDDGKRVVRSAKDRRFDELRATSDEIKVSPAYESKSCRTQHQDWLIFASLPQSLPHLQNELLRLTSTAQSFESHNSKGNTNSMKTKRISRLEVGFVVLTWVMCL